MRYGCLWGWTRPGWCMYVCVHTYKAPANVYIVYLVINCACIDNFHTGWGGVQSWIDHPLLSYSAILQQYSEFCLANTLGCSCAFRTRQVNRSDCSLALRENFEDLLPSIRTYEGYWGCRQKQR